MTRNAIAVEPLANPHCHLREGSVTHRLVELARMGNTDMLGVMPNVRGGLDTAQDVLEYMEYIKEAASSKDITFLPYLMVTEQTTPEDIDEALDKGIRNSKVYPRNRTTKSEKGVRNYASVLPIIKYGGTRGMMFHFHPEYPWESVPNRDAEYMFLPFMDMIVRETDAVCVWEHGTDGRCVPFWKEMAETGRFFVTLTAHHLASNEDRSFGDVRSVCKPPIKLESDRKALVSLVAEDRSWVMAGLDDAPHNVESKHVHEGQCACGAYTSPFGLLLYAHTLDEVLETEAGVETFVNFTSRNARRLHGCSSARRDVILRPESFIVPDVYEADPWMIEPFWAGERLCWTFAAK